MKNAIAKLHTPEFTQKTLVVSTSHYPKSTELALLDEDTDLHDLLSIDTLQFGWLIYITDDAESVKELIEGLIEGKYLELAKLIQLASDNGFDMIRFDSDACVLPEEFGCQVFDWEAEAS